VSGFPYRNLGRRECGERRKNQEWGRENRNQRRGEAERERVYNSCRNESWEHNFLGNVGQTQAHQAFLASCDTKLAGVGSR